MGTPRVSSPLHGIARLPRPSEDPSVRPNTSPGASRDLGSSHSISIGDGAVGPPRSGFVLRVCIRKADQACVKAALHHGLAYTRFCKRRNLQGPNPWSTHPSPTQFHSFGLAILPVVARVLGEGLAGCRTILRAAARPPATWQSRLPRVPIRPSVLNPWPRGGCRG